MSFKFIILYNICAIEDCIQDVGGSAKYISGDMESTPYYSLIIQCMPAWKGFSGVS